METLITSLSYSLILCERVCARVCALTPIQSEIRFYSVGLIAAEVQIGFINNNLVKEEEGSTDVKTNH